MLVMALSTAVVLLLATGAVLDRQYIAMRKMALTSGSAIAAFVADNAALSAADNATLPPAQRDWAPLQAFVRAASADPNVVAMTVVDADGVVEAASNRAMLGRRYLRTPSEAVLERGPGGLVAYQTAVGDRPAFRFIRPITYAGRAFGKIDVSLDASVLAAAARLSSGLLAALAAVILIVVMAVSYAGARMFALPIRRLKAAFVEAADGNLDFRISHRRKDEFGELFDAFNHFAARFQKTLDQRPAARIEPSLPQPSAPASAPKALAPVGDPTRLERPPAGVQTWRDRWSRVAKNGGGRLAAASAAGGS